jgi:hypothetical protein
MALSDAEFTMIRNIIQREGGPRGFLQAYGDKLGQVKAAEEVQRAAGLVSMAVADWDKLIRYLQQREATLTLSEIEDGIRRALLNRDARLLAGMALAATELALIAARQSQQGG